MKRENRRSLLVVVCALVAAVGLLLGVVAVLVVVLDDVQIDRLFDFDSTPACERGAMGSVDVRDGPIVFRDVPEVKQSGHWLLVDENELLGNGRIALVSLDQPQSSPVELATAEEASLSPDGSFLLLTRDESFQVVRMSDQRVVAEIKGKASRVTFIGSSVLAASLSTNECKFGRLVLINLTTRVTTQVKVKGLKAGIIPVGGVGGYLVAERVRHRDLDLESDSGWGVFLVPLGQGRTRLLASYGTVEALVQSPQRVWVRSTGRTEVFDLDGHRTGTTFEARAIALPDGSVAYVSSVSLGCLQPSANDAQLMVSGPEPKPADPKTTVPCVDSDLGLSSGGDTVFVPWSRVEPTRRRRDPTTTVGFLACSVPDLRCLPIVTRTEEFDFAFASVRGVITTPIGPR